MALSIAESKDRVGEDGLIAIVRGSFSVERILEIGEILAEQRLTVMEVTLNTTAALAAISSLQAQLGSRVLVGAGTVRTAAQLAAAIEAGAQFTVAPNFDAATVKLAQAQDFLHVPGVFTASEAQAAHVAGCQLLKLFPSDIVGPNYLKALRAPLNDLDFVPTGGVSAENVATYVRAGAFALGIGSALVTGADQSNDDLSNRAQALRSAWQVAVQK